MKLVVSCYSCSPGRGSEPGMGWNFVRALAKRHELWVFVEGLEFRNVLTDYVASHPDEMRSVHFIFVDNPPHPVLRRMWPPSFYWFYRAWHRRAFRLARELHGRMHFDAAYKLNMVTFREPGYLWKLPIPFIWGPVGAMGVTDCRLFPLLGGRGALEFCARNAINLWQMHVLRRSRFAAQKAARTRTLIAATRENREWMRRLYGVDSELVCEVGTCGDSMRNVVPPRGGGEPLRLAWSGVFETRKALPVLLRALARMRARGDLEGRAIRLDVLGDGPCREKWRALSRRLGVDSLVAWHGWLSRDAAEAVVRGAHVFVMTSVHDLTSTVLLEALGAGVPVVCLDHCGFSDVVTEGCGVKVPVARADSVVDAFADAIRGMFDEGRRLKMSSAAIARAEEHSWTRKSETLDSIVSRVANENVGKGLRK